jgi:HPt (histidine-containing phosphotransfer) domain-containing protein
MLEEALFDLNALRNITDGDEQLEAEFAQLFIITAEKCLDEIDVALPVADTPLFVQAVHRLSGVAANMQAKRLARLCRTIEREASTDINVRYAQLEAIRSAYGEVLPEIQKLIKSEN